MGLFDYVTVHDARFVCSEGHDLSDEEFQSKDFGEAMGRVTIENGKVSTRAVYLEKPEADSDVVEIYCTCTQCSAFVQFGTGNLVSCDVVFEVTLDGDVVTRVTRTSPSTAEWLASEPNERHMRRCEGPMSYADADRLHVRYGELWPEARAEFNAWASTRAQALRAQNAWPLSLRVGEYPDDGDPS